MSRMIVHLMLLQLPLVAFGFVPSNRLHKIRSHKTTTETTETTTTCLQVLSRRAMIAMGAGYVTASPIASRVHAANSDHGNDTNSDSPQPLADLPMIRLRLPQGGFGREYVAISLKIQGQGPYEFMVDTGLTTEFITPHLQNILHISSQGAQQIRGLAAGGDALTPQAIVPLKEASLCCGKFLGDAEELRLPTLTAVITDFPQEHIDPAHDPIEGMIGMEALSLFDVDFDFPAGRLRLWKPGTAAAAASRAHLVPIPAVVINETGLIGIRITAASNSGGQPILGFLDCGSSFSALNWSAAQYLGLPEKGNKSAYGKGPLIQALGIDGRPIQLPTIQEQLSFAGNAQVDAKTNRPVGFEPPPSTWKPWNPVQLAVGDLPAFSSILGDGTTPYKGPAALIGLDILAQRRVILETGQGGTRNRRVYVG